MRRLQFILLFIAQAAYAQEVKVHARFEGDSVRIGLPIRYTVVAQYPSHRLFTLPNPTHYSLVH